MFFENNFLKPGFFKYRKHTLIIQSMNVGPFQLLLWSSLFHWNVLWTQKHCNGYELPNFTENVFHEGCSFRKIQWKNTTKSSEGYNPTITVVTSSWQRNVHEHQTNKSYWSNKIEFFQIFYLFIEVTASQEEPVLARTLLEVPWQRDAYEFRTQVSTR